MTGRGAFICRAALWLLFAPIAVAAVAAFVVAFTIALLRQ